ncbi:hypothetical protein [Chitinasiproducens palmae]|uniref:Uncharacterized protein n=1 Tax=Chitinasiproducens palmae TaxID=1770053 RepID=A0A1H2PSF3_9BURK|nr:hypothetical protein [Chitinasiproducens palmae]SDV49902.1 hypothetical protein SAMN05216551_109227 [Chitinasiproducens palmae]
MRQPRQLALLMLLRRSRAEPGDRDAFGAALDRQIAALERLGERLRRQQAEADATPARKRTLN